MNANTIERGIKKQIESGKETAIARNEDQDTIHKEDSRPRWEMKKG